jgi:hypothetical protein
MDPFTQILAMLGFLLVLGLANLGIGLYLLGRGGK